MLILFIGSLLASTLLPGGVEVLIYKMLQNDQYVPNHIIIVASIGNTIGGIISYAMGVLLRQGLERFSGSWYERLIKRFEFNDKAHGRVKKWGVYALLLSWMPIIGDPLCVVAGYLGLPAIKSAIMIAIGKILRYIILVYFIVLTM